MSKKPHAYKGIDRITCSVVNPMTGVRCGKPSYDSKHARCKVHAVKHPESVAGYGTQLDFSGKEPGTANANRGRYHKR